MSSQQNGFEKSLIEGLENYQVPYSEGSWEEFQRMNATAGGGSGTLIGVIAILAAACAGVILGWYFFGNAASHSAAGAHLSTLTLERGGFPAIHDRTPTADLDFVSGHEPAMPADQMALVADDVTDQVAHHTEIAAKSKRTSEVTSGRKVDLASEDAIVEATTSIEATKRSILKDAPLELPALGDMPAVPISISAREGCEGTSISFNILADGVDGNYLWNFGDGSFSNQPNPVHTYNKSGTYDITLSVTSNKDGVIRTKTMDQFIVINPRPEANFDFTFVGIDEGYPVVEFRNNSRRASQAQWVIADHFSEDINPVQRIDSKGIHVIELVVSNEFGCDNRTARTISLNEDYALMAPARFSPNGDGVFDTFMPRALMTGDHKFTMRIYQDDDVIYETSDPTKPWDGTLSDGSVADPGMTFHWTALLHKAKGDKFYSGQVTVVR